MTLTIRTIRRTRKGQVRHRAAQRHAVMDRTRTTYEQDAVAGMAATAHHQQQHPVIVQVTEADLTELHVTNGLAMLATNAAFPTHSHRVLLQMVEPGQNLSGTGNISVGST